MGLKLQALTRAVWVYHLSTGSCNNCDIEILDCLTPRFDLERFGIQLVGSPSHADALLVTGNMTMKNIDRVKAVYEQVPKPNVVIAIRVDDILPVDLYIPGCPPKPEGMIAGVAKLLGMLRTTS